MDSENKKQSRRRFIGWGIASAAVFSAVKFMLPSAPKKKTVKMLTQDGKLVEVYVEKISYGRRTKISDDQLKNWVSKK